MFCRQSKGSYLPLTPPGLTEHRPCGLVGYYAVLAVTPEADSSGTTTLYKNAHAKSPFIVFAHFKNYDWNYTAQPAMFGLTPRKGSFFITKKR